jgi:hypothetical protein
MVAGFAEVAERKDEHGTTFGAVSGDRKQPTYAFVSWRAPDNPGVDIATSGLSQVDYGAENGAGKRWV